MEYIHDASGLWTIFGLSHSEQNSQSQKDFCPSSQSPPGAVMSES